MQRIINISLIIIFKEILLWAIDEDGFLFMVYSLLFVVSLALIYRPNACLTRYSLQVDQSERMRETRIQAEW